MPIFIHNSNIIIGLSVEFIYKNSDIKIVSLSLLHESQKSQVNLNDKTVEGIRHRKLPIMSVQYHPEASPGPHDSSYLFKSFIGMMKGN